MNGISLFDSEEKTIEQAERLLKDTPPSKAPLHLMFSQVVGSYKKTLKQLKRLIKLSDKQQLKLNEYKEHLELENHSLVLELGKAFESFIRTLSTTIDAKHQYTSGHSHRVTEYGLFIGKKLGLKQEKLEVLKYTGLLHDIGKIGIPDHILTKNGRFTQEERVIMNGHASWTYKILKGMALPKYLKGIPKMAACHHEKMDGTGYPYQLKGDDIPIFSRIIAIGDVFDALTSKRDYPKYDKQNDLSDEPMKLDAALSIIERDQGSHFDPSLTHVILNHQNELEELLLTLHT